MKLGLITLLTLLAFSSTVQAKVSCAAFTKQDDAQSYFDDQKAGYKILDRDKDGEPCECLEGGSKYHERACVVWRANNGKSDKPKPKPPVVPAKPKPAS
jgi:hypothetical protein